MNVCPSCINSLSIKYSYTICRNVYHFMHDTNNAVRQKTTSQGRQLHREPLIGLRELCVAATTAATTADHVGEQPNQQLNCYNYRPVIYVLSFALVCSPFQPCCTCPASKLKKWKYKVLNIKN